MSDKLGMMETAVASLRLRRGEVLEGPKPAVVDRTALTQFLRAVGWPGNSAENTDKIPLSFLVHVGFEPESVLRDARPDESLGGALFDPLNGGCTLRMKRQARLGDSLTRTVRLKEAELRQTRKGPIGAVTIETEISDREGPIGSVERVMLYRNVRKATG